VVTIGDVMKESAMRNLRKIFGLTGIVLGDAKRLTKGYPDGEYIELAGDRYDEV
jgi:hypothetical protein